MEEALRSRIAALLDAACTPLAVGATNGPGLWRSLERTATAALAPLRASGEVVACRVRCDADTNEGSPRGPVLEVIVRLPRRVREVVLRVGLATGD